MVFSYKVHIKMNSLWIKNLSVRPKGIKLLENMHTTQGVETTSMLINRRMKRMCSY